MRYKERGRDKILLKRKEKTFRCEREIGATQRVCKKKIYKNRPRYWQKNRQSDSQWDRQSDRQLDRQNDKQRDRQKETKK